MRASAREHDLVYCYLDAIYLRLRPTDEPAEGVLVAWGLTLEGHKVLLGLQLGLRQSYESWLDFGRDLRSRGMRAPALIIADGAPGIWKATRELWPAAVEQRRSVHAQAYRSVRSVAVLDRREGVSTQAAPTPVRSREPVEIGCRLHLELAVPYGDTTEQHP